MRWLLWISLPHCEHTGIIQSDGNVVWNLFTAVSLLPSDQTSLQTDLLRAFHYLRLEGGQWLKAQLKQRPVWGQVSRKLTLMPPLACVCSNGLWHLVFWKTFVYTITCWRSPVAYSFSLFPSLCSRVIFCVLVSILQFVVIMRAPSIRFIH